VGRARDRAAHRQQDHPAGANCRPDDLKFVPLERRG
jgi:hypothetical protein